MTFWRRALTACALGSALLGLAGCWTAASPDTPSPHFDPDRLAQRQFLAMGTSVSITVYRRADQTPHQADAALDDAEQYLREFGRDWWAWGDGALGAINRDLATGRRAQIPARMRPLFDRARDIHRLTGGLFEPRIGSLVRLWGFDDVARLRDTPPDEAAIAAAVQALHAAPDYDGSGYYGPASDITWDFGAIAKGYCVDQTLERLRAEGFGDALVDAGGNLAVRGHKGDRPWKIAIRHPRAEAGIPLLATLESSNEAVNTHGDYERHIDFQGRRYGHILDPTTGYPADSLISVTVVGADGTEADGAGAALFVAGATAWQALARQLGLSQVLVVDHEGRAIATAALARRLTPAAGVHLQIVP